MAARYAGSEIAPEHLRLMLLDYGLDYPYKVVSLNDVARAIPHVNKEMIQQGLDQLVEEGLLSRFTRRYCFNKPIPQDLRRDIGELVTPSGTIRIKDGLGA